MNALVSVVIPTMKRPLLLKRAVESVINQTYQNIEILIIDVNEYNSKGQIATRQIVNDLSKGNNIQYLSFPNLNGSQARNKGIEHSKGNLIAFLDDDDFFEGSKIKKQAEVLELNQSSNCHAVSSLTQVINGFSKQSRVVKLNSDLEYFEDVLFGMVHFNTSTLFFTKDILVKMNGFDERLARYQDYDLMVRYTQFCKLVVINEPLVTLDQQDRVNYSKIHSIVDSKKYLADKYDGFLNKKKLKIKYLKKDKIDILKAALFNKKITLFFQTLLTRPNLNFYEYNNLIVELISKGVKFKLNQKQ
jgi:glycosyltransferase involved in cell wall biosynthesis